MAQILVVEDDRAIAELVRLYLRRDGHEVELMDDGVAALHRLEATAARTDLVILDLMLPGLDGRGVCRRVRARSNVPILMLTALDDARDKIEGLELGADDYVTKPFNPAELVARVHAILRRTERTEASKRDDAARALVLGNTRIDPARRRVVAAGAEIPLRTKEFDLLLALAAHPGIVHTREHLLEQVWGGDFLGDTRTVDVHVSRLRDKLASGHATITIETIRSVGYRLGDGG